MKKIALLLMTMVLTGLLGTVNAQNETKLSDKALSAQFKQEIDILNSEVKTLKIKLKTDKTNSALQGELVAKREQIKELSSKKKTIDNAIKSKEAAIKASKKAEKAAKKAEEHAANAQKLKN